MEQYEGQEPFVQVSKNLSNAAHLDPGDNGRSHAVWMRTNYMAKEPEGWYLLFPDVGLAIELCHGACVSWDGRMTRHCTSIPHSMAAQDTLYSYFFGLNTPLTRARGRIAAFKAARAYRRSHEHEYPAYEPGMEVWVRVCDEERERVRVGVVEAVHGETMSLAFLSGKDSRKALKYATSDRNVVLAHENGVKMPDE